MKKVYLSGPITKGNRSWNFFQASEAHKMLMEAGFAVLNPMLSMMHPDAHSIEWDKWIASDLAFVACCDCVVRLPGESKGADVETAFAESRRIPIVRVSDLIELSDAILMGVFN